jgi:NADH-quinone oxidoreductase subunit L
MVDSYGKPLEHGVETRVELMPHELEPVETPPPYGSEGFNLAHAVESKVHSETATEWVFILISLLVAGIGIGLGYLFYVKDTRLPDIWAARLRPLYQASYNKYWVDEFFGWAVTRRVMDAARAVFAFDSKVVDGGVNGTAWLTRFSSRVTGLTDEYFVDGVVNAVAAFVMRLMSPLLRAAQTGLTQNYALVMVLGLVAAVVMFFGADILKAIRSIFALGL